MSRKAKKMVRKYGLSALLVTVILLLILLVAVAIRSLGGSTGDTVQNTDTAPSTHFQQGSVTNTAPETDGSQTTDSVPATDSADTDSESEKNSASDKPLPEEELDFSAWNLILLNPDNALPEGFEPDLKKFSFNGTSGYVDARTYDAFHAMFSAAKEDGITLTVRSAYRSVSTQTVNFNNKVQEYKNKGYSDEKAFATAATIIAVPGTSEHHTGLAMDILTPSYNRLNEGFAQTDAAKWLFAHCAEYGFILRYPEDKTDITKIIYEPWHYRYVGVTAAKIITEEGICYEEFVAKYGTP